MRKIGILTHYYNSDNYGGNLQAYALVRFLHLNGLDAEQISYLWENPVTIKAPQNIREKIQRLTFKRILYGVETRSYRVFWKILGRNKKYEQGKEDRKNRFEYFNKNLISHSSRIYNGKNIKDSLDIYDVFIVGSDQVWNPDCYVGAFHLDFAGDNKKKIAYGASVAQKQLIEKEKLIFSKTLNNFDVISVRERKSIELLQPLTDKKIEYVCDPSLLLDKKEWEEISRKSNKEFPENYIFCYFIGNNTTPYRAIKKYAKKRKLKIVNIPYMSDYYLHGNYILSKEDKALSPEDFVHAINDAEVIFTDSFHAVVFSIIFRKQFFVFDRDRFGDINIRLIDFLESIGLRNRFCELEKRQIYRYIFNEEDIDYRIIRKLLESFIRKSKNYLRTALEM